MLLFEVQKNPENINQRVSKNSNGKTMLLSKCVICGGKRSRFIGKQQANGILSSLGVKTPLSVISLFGHILF